jgi:putative SOS response-associated peptidase YedK
MCNEQRNRIAAGLIRDDFQDLRIPLEFPEALPNLEPRDSIRITDRNAIIRPAAAADGTAELVVRRWSWPGAGGRPVYNFRSEGRRFARRSRCLIVADGFYEFTAPEGGAKRKTKWLFTKSGESWFAIAGTWRTDPAIGEAYTMLTTEPGPDVAPYHGRQVVVLERRDWRAWLSEEAADLSKMLTPSPAGTFAVERVA